MSPWAPTHGANGKGSSEAARENGVDVLDCDRSFTGDSLACAWPLQHPIDLPPTSPPWAVAGLLLIPRHGEGSGGACL